MADQLHLGIVVPAFFYVPYWAALEQGFYADAGLDVTVTAFGGIEPVTQALRDGSIQVGVGSPEHVIHDVEAGGDLRMVGGNVNRLTHDLIAQPEIKQLEDLRGKVIGVSSLSGGTSSLFMEIMKGVGLEHPRDYTLVAAGVVPPRHEMLMRREIDAGMQTDPHNYIAEDAGLSNLGPVSQWIPYFQFTSVNVRLGWADSHPDTLTRFLVASIRGSRWMANDQAGAVDLARRRMGVEERYAVRAWHDHIDGDALPLDLHLDSRSIQTAMDMIRNDRSSTFTIPIEAAPGRYVAERFLQQAQRSAAVPERTLV